MFFAGLQATCFTKFTTFRESMHHRMSTQVFRRVQEHLEKNSKM